MKDREEYISILEQYNAELKKQLEEHKKELEKADNLTQICIFKGKEESKISYRKCLNILDKKETQQKEFISYLEDKIKYFKNLEQFAIKTFNNKAVINLDLVKKSMEEDNLLIYNSEEILQKYKETIGDDK